MIRGLPQQGVDEVHRGWTRNVIYILIKPEITAGAPGGELVHGLDFAPTGRTIGEDFVPAGRIRMAAGAVLGKKFTGGLTSGREVGVDPAPSAIDLGHQVGGEAPIRF